MWIGGSSPLDVEGFRSHGRPIMQAYRYFWRNGHVIGRARAGTMGFDSQHGRNHWHFEQFAEYRLLTAGKKLAVRSRKVGFCIAPTHNVDMALPHATWQEFYTGFFGECGTPTAVWVREMLPVDWGNTYFQSVAGQSFDVTHLPNGTYYIEVIANPERVLHETTTRNDTSLRKVIISGTADHRTIRVPAWNGLNPGGGYGGFLASR
ncbi:MAG: lysyl oxidase family protein [Streptosporangiaceae bacterium]